jgi:hypothetical protein
VPDSLDTSLELGLDVRAWLEEELVDVLAVGMGYMPYVLPLDEWQELGRHHGAPVYPSINTNTFVRWWKVHFQRPEAWQEAVRAACAYYWQEGAEGQYLFNVFCLADKRVGPQPLEFTFAPLREAGDPTALVGKDKIYAIQPTRDSGFCHHGSAPAPLPIALDNVERKLCLRVGPDATDEKARFRLHLHCSGGQDDMHLRLRLNHALLSETTRERDRRYLELPSGLLRPGRNELSLWTNVPIADSERPLLVHSVFLAATYSG